MPEVTQESQQNSTSKWVRRLIIFTVIALVATQLFRWLTPEAIESDVVILENYDGSETSYSNIQYVGEAIAVPAQLPTGTATRTQLSASDFKQKIIDEFGLVLEPETEEGFGDVYSSTQFELYESPDHNYFQVTNKVPTDAESIDTQTALQTAQTLADTLYPETTMSRVVSETEYLITEDGEYESTTPDEANVMKISFSSTVGNYPVYENQNVFFPLTVWINNEYEVERLIAFPYYYAVENSDSVPTLTYTQALSNIENDNASILDTHFLGAGFLTLNEISSATLSSGQVEYRFNMATQTAIPYYRFRGSATNAQSQEFDIDIITPAIQTNFSN